MIRSMTGFGRASFEVEASVFEVEIRTVNGRHLDARARLPRPLADHEPLVKALVSERLKRGKVDVSVTAAGGASESGALQIDASVAAQYVAASRRLAETHAVPEALDTAKLLALPGVTRFVESTLSPDAMAAGLAEGVAAALTALVEMRVKEGAALAADFAARLDKVVALVDFFEQRAGQVVEAASQRLRRRAEQIRQEVGLVDDARLHQEIVIAADRLDITEELVRLRSHVEQFRGIVDEASADDPVGRRLDFLLQEMGREANTIGSKASDAPLAHNVVDLKAELERLREQVQNVE